MDDDGAYNYNQEEELGDDENQEENEDRVEAAEAEGLSCYPRGANAPNCHSVFIWHSSNTLEAGSPQGDLNSPVQYFGNYSGEEDNPAGEEGGEEEEDLVSHDDSSHHHSVDGADQSEPEESQGVSSRPHCEPSLYCSEAELALTGLKRKKKERKKKKKEKPPILLFPPPSLSSLSISVPDPVPGLVPALLLAALLSRWMHPQVFGDFILFLFCCLTLFFSNSFSFLVLFSSITPLLNLGNWKEVEGDWCSSWCHVTQFSVLYQFSLWKMKGTKLCEFPSQTTPLPLNRGCTLKWNSKEMIREEELKWISWSSTPTIHWGTAI